MGLRVGVDGRYLRDDYPGVGRHLFQLLRALAAAAGDDELIVLHDPGAPRTRLDPAALAGPRTALVEAPIRPRSLQEQVALPRLVRRLRLDLFHAPYPFTAWRCPCPRVVTVYDLVALDPLYGLGSRSARALAGIWLRGVARGAAGVMALSQASRAALVARLTLRPERVAVTRAAVDPRFRPADPAAVDAARRALGLPARYVLQVGASKPHKNLGRLLEAWGGVRRAGASAALVLAGGTPASARELRARARGLGLEGVHVLGPVADEHLPAVYTAAELLALPSLDEGFGLPVLEAMACGAPVACSSRGVLRETAGEAAAFFDPGDARAIARTLVRLLADGGERRELSGRGLGHVRRFSWEGVAARTWTVYRAAARGAARVAEEGDATAAPAVFGAR